METRLEGMVDRASTHPTKGYFTIGRVRGVSVLVHWSFPVGGLLLAGFTGFEPRATLYFCLGYALLILLHELGHVAAARFFGLKVFSIELSGVGGLCRIEGPRRIRDTFLVFSAGLFIQLGLLLTTLVWLVVFGMPQSVFGSSFVLTFTLVNLFLIAVNAIPTAQPNGLATDGYVLWRLFLHVRGKGPHPMLAATPSRVFPPETHLYSMRELVPDGFIVGVEILNDNTTPMDLVVAVLMTHLRLEREKAIHLMLAIHQKGGVLLPLTDLEEAKTVADGIARDAHERGHNLICRAVDTRQLSSAGGRQS
jgi:ATP-dependent Clp protease adapter protein ClpS